jgi:O-acetylhomoserine/O-acetylserine sulfhydrylase-like pyridoxal-dependent enzyme
MKDETKCLHAGYHLKNAEPRVVPNLDMDALELASNKVCVADICTSALHLPSETHHQLNDEQLAAAGIDTGMVHISGGLENVTDII